MSKIHKLKFAGVELCDAVYDGRKSYEIRVNDRDYEVGDIIEPIPCDEVGGLILHPLSKCRYEITFITHKWRNALSTGYCVFAIRKISEG